MNEIRIEKYDSAVHCINCGIQTVSSISNFDKKDSISICPHLVYLGKGSGFDEDRPEYCKFYDVLIEIGSENYFQTIRDELSRDHICLNITSSQVHLPRYFIIYNLGIDSIEEEEDCPYWNVWGPTLEKYGITRSQETQK
jgi:hypothetical protein